MDQGTVQALPNLPVPPLEYTGAWSHLTPHVRKNLSKVSGRQSLGDELGVCRKDEILLLLGESTSVANLPPMGLWPCGWVCGHILPSRGLLCPPADLRGVLSSDLAFGIPESDLHSAKLARRCFGVLSKFR